MPRRWQTILVFTLIIAGCAEIPGFARSFDLNFPADVSMGELWLMEDVNCFTCGNGSKNLGRATGRHRITLPAAHWYVRLRMPKNAAALMPRFSEPSLAQIGDLDLRGSDISDDDLKHLAGVELRSIALSRTSITGAGLRHLKPHKKWIFVSLEDCERLDPAHLAHFRGWKRATIRVTSNRYNDPRHKVRMDALLNKAREIICDNRPEESCGTQIR